MNRQLEHKYYRIQFDDIGTAATRPQLTWQVRSLVSEMATQDVSRGGIIGLDFRITSMDFMVRMAPGITSAGVRAGVSPMSLIGDLCRFVVVQDNDAQQDSTNTYATLNTASKVFDSANNFDLYTSGTGASDVYDQREPVWKRRFTVKKDIIHTMTTTSNVSSTMTGAYNTFGTGDGVFRFRILFKGGLLMRKTSDTPSVDPLKNGNYTGKDLFVMYCANSNDCCTLQYRCYVNFVDA